MDRGQATPGDTPSNGHVTDGATSTPISNSDTPGNTTTADGHGEVSEDQKEQKAADGEGRDHPAALQTINEDGSAANEDPALEPFLPRLSKCLMKTL